MRCAECKFWSVDDEDGKPEADFSGAGDCRRRAPVASFDAAIVVANNLMEWGTVRLQNPEKPKLTANAWHDRVASWPVTYGHHFCGDFSPAEPAAPDAS